MKIKIVIANIIMNLNRYKKTKTKVVNLRFCLILIKEASFRFPLLMFKYHRYKGKNNYTFKIFFS